MGLKDAEERDLPLAGLGELVRAMEEASETVAFDIEGLGAILAKPKSWEALTVDEMRNVTAALKNIRQAARNMNTVIEGEARAEKAFVIEKLGEEIRAHLPDLGPDKNQDAMSAIERGAAAVSAFDGELLRPETMISWMGGGLNSTWWRAVFKPLNDAKIKESDLMRKTVKPIVEALHAVPENIRRRMNETVDGKALFPEHTAQKEGPTRRFHVLALFLNSGNESNLKRLTEGRNITPAQIAAAIDLLTKEETDWLQSILDSIETLGKDSFDLEERDSGVRPEKVRATPIATRHGTYRGGYFPLVGDSVGNQGKRVAGQELSSLMDPSFTRPGTSHSHLKSRAGRARYIVSLDLNVVQSHLAKAVHDIAFRESVKSVGSLLQSEEVQELMRRHLGEGRARTLWQWVKDAGSMRGAEVLTHAPGATRFVNGLKGRMGPAVLGYAVDVVMGDLGNPFVALASTTLKTKHLAAGMAEFITSPRETIAFVHEKSGEMRFRDNSFSSEFNRAMKSVTQTRNVATRVLDAFTANAFQVFEYSELVSTTGVWMGAYRQAMQEGQSDADAVTYANAVIRKIVPANSAIDKPEILRSKGGVAALLMFHGYMNTVYNLYRDAAHPLYTMALEGKGRPRTVAGVAARTLGIAVSVALVSEFLSGKGPEPSDGEDEAERWANWAKRKLLMSPLQAVPLLGEAVEGVAGAASGKRVSARGAPAAGVGIEIAKAVFKAQQEGKDDWDKVLGLVKAAGMMKGLPVRPLRALDYLHDLLVGDKELSAETPSALIYGLRDEQPANPLKPYAGTAAPAQ